jgi:hypothetical protein
MKLNLFLKQHSKRLFLISFLLCLFCTPFLNGCSSKKQIAKAQMGVPIRVHERLTLNVLSYKLITAKEELPDVPVLSGNRKYLAIRLIISNPGKNRGVAPATLLPMLDKVEISHPMLKDKTIEVNMDHMMSDLQKFNFDQSGIAMKPIAAGESETAWVVAIVPKDLNPPYTLTFNMNDSKGPTRSISVDLR